MTGDKALNRTKIEWCDWTWNPVTGCWGPGGTAEEPKRCSYCYAQKMAKRFRPSVEGITEWASSGKRDDPFAPRIYADRLHEPTKIKKPSKIFVCSMADLFGDWVPTLWIAAILEAVYRNPQHTFQFLTKNPKRLIDFNPWPGNSWVGTTVTCQADEERLFWLLKVDASVRFVSHEPLPRADSVRKTLAPGLYRGPVAECY